MRLYINGIWILMVIILNSCLKDSSDAHKLISKVRKEFLKQVNEDQYYLKIHCLEKAKVDKHHVAFSEGYGHLISLGYDFMIPVDNYSLLFDNIRKATSKQPWIEYLSNTYKQTNIFKQSDICPSYNALLNSYRWFEINGPLSFRNKDKYEYELVNPNSSLNNFSIYFSPSDTLRKFSYYGTIIFDSETNLLKKVELDSCLFYSEPLRERILASLSVDFIFRDKCIYLSELSANYSIDNLEHWIEIEVVDSVVNDIFLSMNECKQLSLNDSNPMVVYNKFDWEEHFKKINKNYIEIKNDLETNNISLDRQFLKNSGSSFYSMKTSGKKDNIDYELINSIKGKIK